MRFDLAREAITAPYFFSMPWVTRYYDAKFTPPVRGLLYAYAVGSGPYDYLTASATRTYPRLLVQASILNIQSTGAHKFAEGRVLTQSPRYGLVLVRYTLDNEGVLYADSAPAIDRYPASASVDLDQGIPDFVNFADIVVDHKPTRREASLAYEALSLGTRLFAPVWGERAARDVLTPRGLGWVIPALAIPPED